jgi:hypothetical protein
MRGAPRGSSSRRRTHSLPRRRERCPRHPWRARARKETRATVVEGVTRTSTAGAADAASDRSTHLLSQSLPRFHRSHNKRPVINLVQLDLALRQNCFSTCRCGLRRPPHVKAHQPASGFARTRTGELIACSHARAVRGHQLRALPEQLLQSELFESSAAPSRAHSKRGHRPLVPMDATTDFTDSSAAPATCISSREADQCRSVVGTVGVAIRWRPR